MSNITKFDGSALPPEARGVKVRLGDVFKRPGQGMKEFMDELRALSTKDLEDFKIWFEAAGFPCLSVAYLPGVAPA